VRPPTREPPIGYGVYGGRVTVHFVPRVTMPSSQGRPFEGVMHLLHAAYARRRVCRRMVRDYPPEPVA
jgi:hypothetical protein